MKVIKPCNYCGKEMMFYDCPSNRPSGRGKFCSRECAIKGQPPGSVTSPCQQCGKPVTEVLSRISEGKGKFCSKDCHNKYKSHEKLPVKCLFCGSAFETTQTRINTGRGVFCSKECRYNGLARTLEQRFWKHVVKAEGNACWLWNGTDTGHYGTLPYKHKSEGSIGAHVFSYQLHYGPVPKGKIVRHKCDVRSCVRPDHLLVGTMAQNSRDAAERGRIAKGERQGAAKLTKEQVREIRAGYVKGKTRQRDIAAKYGVSQGTVWQIVTGNYWKHV